MQRTNLLIAFGILVSYGCVSHPSCQETIAPSDRKKIDLPTPVLEQIVVLEKYRGVHEVKDKFGRSQQVDFGVAYRSGFLAGWKEFFELFRAARFDLDEAEDRDGFALHFIMPYQTIGGEPFRPGQVDGAMACRDELLNLAQKRDLLFLPARPIWLKRLLARGACDPAVNEAGRPTVIWWNYTTMGQTVCDDDLRFLKDVSAEDIESFGLDHVAVTDAGITSLPPMPRLSKLMLSGPNLTGACLRDLQRFPRLTCLELPGLRSLSAADLAELRQLKELSFLDLGGTDIGDDAIPVFVAMPKLRVLILDFAQDGSSGPRFTPAAITKLSQCRNLECLRLSGCAVDDKALAALSEALPRLKDLFLAQTQVTDASIGCVRKLERLEWLNLARTRVTNAGIAALAGHPSLQTLSMEGSAVTDPALAKLDLLPKLQEVWVYKDQFCETGWARFAKQRPDVSLETVSR